MIRFTFKHFLRSVLLALCVSIPLQATTITDAPNDFLATFTGTHSSDIDALSVFATFDGVTFHIGATVNASVGTLPTALYVFGVNRGAQTANFAQLGLPGVVFDSVITITGAGVTGGRDLAANAPLVLPPGAAQISGSSFQIDVPLALLPSLGLSPLEYGFNLWPRDASQVGDAQIADFAPNSTVFTASAVPEPSSVLLLLFGAFTLVMVRPLVRQ